MTTSPTPPTSPAPSVFSLQALLDAPSAGRVSLRGTEYGVYPLTAAQEQAVADLFPVPVPPRDERGGANTHDAEYVSGVRRWNARASAAEAAVALKMVGSDWAKKDWPVAAREAATQVLNTLTTHEIAQVLQAARFASVQGGRDPSEEARKN